MNIIVDFPPNIDNIRAIFPITGKEIFAWGDTIYNPSDAKLTGELLAHERTHSKQQGSEVPAWWDRYLFDEDFRFKQELEAHQVEYAVHKHYERDRNKRRVYLKTIARRLSSPMYGRVVTFNKAKKLIKQDPSDE